MMLTGLLSLAEAELKDLEAEAGSTVQSCMDDVVWSLFRATKEIHPIWSAFQIHSLLSKFHQCSVFGVQDALRRLAAKKQIRMIRRGVYSV